MTQSMTRFLTRLSHAFCADQLDHIAQNFTYPLPFYAKGELLVFGAPNALVEALAPYREAARKADIVRITPRIVASGLPRKGYSTVWVEWDHFDSEDTLLCTSQVRYAVFQDKLADKPRIELVDYTALAFPEVSDSLPLLETA